MSVIFRTDAFVYLFHIIHPNFHTVPGPPVLSFSLQSGNLLPQQDHPHHSQVHQAYSGSAAACAGEIQHKHGAGTVAAGEGGGAVICIGPEWAAALGGAPCWVALDMVSADVIDTGPPPGHLHYVLCMTLVFPIAAR